MAQGSEKRRDGAYMTGEQEGDGTGGRRTKYWASPSTIIVVARMMCGFRA
ncbi:hypothetical protein [Hyphococcus sp.]